MVGPSRVQLSRIFRDCVCPLPGVEWDSAFRVNARDAAHDHDRPPTVRGHASAVALFQNQLFVDMPTLA